MEKGTKRIWLISFALPFLCSIVYMVGVWQIHKYHYIFLAVSGRGFLFRCILFLLRGKSEGRKPQQEYEKRKAYRCGIICCISYGVMLGAAILITLFSMMISLGLRGHILGYSLVFICIVYHFAISLDLTDKIRFCQNQALSCKESKKLLALKKRKLPIFFMLLLMTLGTASVKSNLFFPLTKVEWVNHYLKGEEECAIFPYPLDKNSVESCYVAPDIVRSDEIHVTLRTEPETAEEYIKNHPGEKWVIEDWEMIMIHYFWRSYRAGFYPEIGNGDIMYMVSDNEQGKSGYIVDREGKWLTIYYLKN